MSRFDRADPGSDPDYCAGLSGQRSAPTKGQQFLERDAVIEQAVSRALISFAALTIEVARLSDVDRAWQLRQTLNLLQVQMTDLYDGCVSKVDALSKGAR